MPKVYVVMQNDYPNSVFDSREGAEQYVSRQPTRSLHGHHLHWHVHMFTVSQAGRPMTAASTTEFHPDSNLPGCMMPDGGDCCGGYLALLADWRRLRK